MAKGKPSALAAPFQGRWRIAEMDLWDQDALDLVAPASLEIKGSEGEMRFIAVRAWLDIRYTARAGGPVAEFSWEASTRAISAQAGDGSNPEPQAASSATSTSTWATTPASSVSRGEFFNSLLDDLFWDRELRQRESGILARRGFFPASAAPGSGARSRDGLPDGRRRAARPRRASQARRRGARPRLPGADGAASRRGAEDGTARPPGQAPSGRFLGRFRAHALGLGSPLEAAGLYRRFKALLGAWSRGARFSG